MLRRACAGLITWLLAPPKSIIGECTALAIISTTIYAIFGGFTA